MSGSAPPTAPVVLLLNPPSTRLQIRDLYCSITSKGSYYWPPIDLLVLSGLLNEKFRLVVIDAVAEGRSPSEVMEAVLAARRSIVTVEEIVLELEPRPHAVVLPHWTLSAVAAVPGGAWPSYAAGYSIRDNEFYERWDEIARDRDEFEAWMRENVLEADSPAPVGSGTEVPAG